MKPHRQTPCDACGNHTIVVVEDTKIRGFTKAGTPVLDEIYSEYCENCGNLLYGYARPSQ